MYRDLQINKNFVLWFFRIHWPTPHIPMNTTCYLILSQDRGSASPQTALHWNYCMWLSILSQCGRATIIALLFPVTSKVRQSRWERGAFPVTSSGVGFSSNPSVISYAETEFDGLIRYISTNTLALGCLKISQLSVGPVKIAISDEFSERCWLSVSTAATICEFEGW